MSGVMNPAPTARGSAVGLIRHPGVDLLPGALRIGNIDRLDPRPVVGGHQVDPHLIGGGGGRGATTDRRRSTIGDSVSSTATAVPLLAVKAASGRSRHRGPAIPSGREKVSSMAAPVVSSAASRAINKAWPMLRGLNTRLSPHGLGPHQIEPGVTESVHEHRHRRVGVHRGPLKPGRGLDQRAGTAGRARRVRTAPAPHPRHRCRRPHPPSPTPTGRTMPAVPPRLPDLD